MAEFDHLRALLVSLPNFQKPGTDYNTVESDLANHVSEKFERAERDFLESFIDPSVSEFDMEKVNKFVFITPYTKHNNVYLPLLTVSAHYDGAKRPEAHMKVLLYVKPHAGDYQCLCYRFDTPNRTDGDHSYFHMQFDWGAKGGQKNRDAIDWVSLGDPRIPVDATTPVEMFFAAFFSFRNLHSELRHVTDEWSQAGIPMADLMKGMAMSRWRLPWPNPLAQVQTT